MNNIIEQNYREIEENIIDTENPKLSKLIEQVASNNIDSVNKGINPCLFMQRECKPKEKYYNPDLDKSSTTDTDMFPTSLHVHMVANYHTSEFSRQVYFLQNLSENS
jgi:hypothetical protein